MTNSCGNSSKKNTQEMYGFFELLRTNNYVILNKEPNLLGGPKYFEYTFFKIKFSILSIKLFIIPYRQFLLFHLDQIHH